MAALMAVIATGAIFVGLYALATNKNERGKFIRETMDNPIGAMFAALMIVSGLAFFWGVMIPGFGAIPLWLFGYKFHVWSAGGIGFIVFLGLLNLSLKKNQ